MLPDVDPNTPTRRDILAGGTAAAMTALIDNRSAWAAEPKLQKASVKGNVNQSVCLWCYKGMSVAEMAPVAQQLGLKGIDLLEPKQWGPLKQHGLVCSLTAGVVGGITNGLNDNANHERIAESLKNLIDVTADAGYPNVVCFSGNRRGMSDEEGLRNCARGLKLVMAHAERKKVTVVMELLNSKIDHVDYMADHTAWGVELCKAVGSDRFKLLYDIYHMQIMEGDIIRTMRQYKDYIAHVHTGGNPGRNEIDERQELAYPAIMKSLRETGFTGFVGQEFIPTAPDPIESLSNAVKICDV